MRYNITCRVWPILFFIVVFSLSYVNGQQRKPVAASGSPNIVIIFCDDMGYGDIGKYGAAGYSTPNIDQLTSEGMMFTQFYAAEAVCSASRAALLTGCYSNRIGIFGALMPWSKNGLNKNELTIAEMLKQKGYATGIFGKWHLGYQQQFLPLQHGFDEYTGLPYSNDMWPVNFDGQPITDTANWKIKYPPLPLIQGNSTAKEIRTLDDQATLTTLYTEKAVDFIGRNKNKPFFLYLPHSMPHVPIAASAKFRGKTEAGLYGDVIMEIDWSVGEIMKTLKQYNLEKNTLVVFTSDNGPWLNFGNHAGSTGGLREGKGSSWEGGQKEPCVMRWPGIIPAGTVCNKLSSTIDLLPTIAAICNGQLPTHKIDGVNILPLLKAVKDAEPRKVFYYYYASNHLEAVRRDHWKLVLPHPGRSYEGFAPGKDGFPGGTTETRQYELALYDLRRDPGERYDVKEFFPDIVAQLQELAEIARDDMGDAITNRKGKNNRDCGWEK
jgi:arylsulfatase A-like enzyme